jgi:hypothetical protein
VLSRYPKSPSWNLSEAECMPVIPVRASPGREGWGALSKATGSQYVESILQIELEKNHLR